MSKSMTTKKKLIEDYKSTMDVVCAYIQENELWDMIEKVSSITNEIENLLTLFDN